MRKILGEHKEGNAIIEKQKLEHYRQEFLEAINDNLNTPLALGVLFSMVKNEPKSKDVYDLAMDFDRVFAIGLDRGVEEKLEEIPAEIEQLAKLRWEAKLNKDWAQADKYRNEITEKGYMILDSKDGYRIEKK